MEDGLITMNVNADEEKKREGTVYLAKNLLNDKVYVGITTRPLSLRISEHIHDSKVGNFHSDTYFHKAIRKYGSCSFAFSAIEQISCSSEQELRNKLYELERYYINFYQSNNKHFGYNLTNGGDGITGYKLTPEHKLKVSIANKGKRLSEEHKRKISEFMSSDKNPNIGRVVSAETKEKISKANKGRLSGSRNPMYGISRPDLAKRNKEGSLPVCQIDLASGNLIKIWDSLREIQRQTGYNRNCIRDCCRHRTHQSHGYKWEFYTTNKSITEIKGD